MTQIRWITPEFAVAGQLTPEDVAAVAAQGVKAIINNRPDGEQPGQPAGAEIEAAARAHGLAYRALPFTGPPPPNVVAETATLLDATAPPVLAYCRTGTRSVTAWAMAQALAGARKPEEIIALVRAAGYDIGSTREALRALAPRH